MRIDGKRIKRLRGVHTDRYVVVVNVEAVISWKNTASPRLESPNRLHTLISEGQADRTLAKRVMTS